jgi:guanine deaminase
MFIESINQLLTRYLDSSSAESVRDTEKLIEHILPKNESTLVPIITPRFAPTCSRQLLESLADLATKYSLPVQTHLCETNEEIKWVKSLFPECSSYTDVYKECGILRPGCVLAHCVYMQDQELDAVKETGSGISHCPNSNMSLQTGIMPCRRYLDRGVKVGLGTDVAGGFSSSIMDSMRACIGVSKVYRSTVNPSDRALTLAEAFYLATLGGAELLNLKDQIGSFQPGKEFDALVVSYDTIDHEPEHETIEEIFEKFVYLGDDRNVKQVFVKGRSIKKLDSV